MPQPLRSSWVRYGAAVVLVSAALAVKLLLVPLLSEDVPFVLFFAAVMGAAAFGGLGPGLLATAIAAGFDSYFFNAPFGHFQLATVGQRLRMILFLIEGGVISVICARLKSARQRADENAAEARDLERRILEISDAEQRRIGHDLHDGLGQHLTGIALMMQRLGKRLSTAGAPDAAEAVKVSEMAKTAVKWTHDLCRSLSPPVLESSGLAEALRELAAHAENIFSIDCTFEQSGEDRPTDLTAGVHLYRISQEAISNAVRHGGAKHVQIKLDTENGGLSVRIIDDGSGIQPQATSADGMGLRIMRYRAKMIGASIDVSRRDYHGGTVITCRYSPTSDTKAAITYANG